MNAIKILDWVRFLVLAAGLALIIYLQWFADKPVVETPKPAVVQDDNSVVIERTATIPKAKPKHKVPKGSKVERVIGVDVQPDGVGIKPVHVDLSLVREEDGGKRVIASSLDGDVVGGLDIPVDTNFVPPRNRWAMGLSLGLIHQTPGVWIERDLSRIRVKVEAIAGRSGHLPEFRAGIGWSW